VTWEEETIKTIRNSGAIYRYYAHILDEVCEGIELMADHEDAEEMLYFLEKKKEWMESNSFSVHYLWLKGILTYLRDSYLDKEDMG
jgi:hypothetical protein